MFRIIRPCAYSRGKWVKSNNFNVPPRVCVCVIHYMYVIDTPTVNESVLPGSETHRMPLFFKKTAREDGVEQYTIAINHYIVLGVPFVRLLCLLEYES